MINTIGEFTMHTETVTTHDIRVGDVIEVHGLVLLIDQEPHQTNHPVNGFSPTLATRARILNWDDVVAQAQAGRSDLQFIVGLVNDDPAHQIANDRTPDTEPRWTVQGNGLARWTRRA